MTLCVSCQLLSMFISSPPSAVEPFTFCCRLWPCFRFITFLFSIICMCRKGWSCAHECGTSGGHHILWSWSFINSNLGAGNQTLVLLTSEPYLQHWVLTFHTLEEERVSDKGLKVNIDPNPLAARPRLNSDPSDPGSRQTCKWPPPPHMYMAWNAETAPGAQVHCQMYLLQL